MESKTTIRENIGEKILSLFNRIIIKFKPKQESNLVKHARYELELAGYFKENGDIDELMANDVLELINVFSKQGHSGFSAPHCIQLFKQLANYEIITPLTGKDDEWNDISGINGGEMYQNNRDSRVFKNGRFMKAYFIEAIVFRSDSGGLFTGTINNVISSSHYIKSFPFIPKTFYVDVINYRCKDKDGLIPDDGGDWWTHKIKDESQLIPVFEYYDKREL